MSYIEHFTTQADGAILDVFITHYQPEIPAINSGHPDNWEPSEPAEVDFQLELDGELYLDLSPASLDSIKRECLDHMEMVHKLRDEPDYEDRDLP